MNVIESRTTGITIKMNLTPEIYNFTISPESYMIGVNTTYLFIIESKNVTFNSGEALMITFPPALTISLNVFCIPKGNITNVICTQETNGILKAVFTFIGGV